MKRRFWASASERTVRLLLTLLAATVALAQDPKEIFRLSIEKDQNNRALRQQYTYLEKGTQREFDKSGNVKSTNTTVHDVTILYGHPFSRLIEKNGKPLSAAEEKKEKDKLEKFTARWANESPREREKRLAQRERNRQKSDAFLREIPEAYDLTLAGEEKVGGKEAWVISAEPHPGYKAKLEGAKYFSKIHGKIWIDKAEYQWVKAEAETIDTISFGLVLFRLYKGSRLQFEQTRVNDEVWMPKMSRVMAGGRLGIFMKASIDQTTIYENYRKFQTDSKVVSTAEVP